MPQNEKVVNLNTFFFIGNKIFINKGYFMQEE